MTTSVSETSVLIVGGGPVGLTLAMCLAQQGIAVTVLEQRPPGEPPSVKCNHVAARSMEIFRRLGIAEEIRDAGLPPDHANDVAFRTTFAGREITRIPIPCRRDRYTSTDGPDTWWPTPEPPHRINQIYLEPVLFRAAARHPNIRIESRIFFEKIEKNGEQLFAITKDLGTDETRRYAAAYVIGCDGGRSQIRGQIGASFVGDPVVQRVQSSYIRAPGLLDRLEVDPAWATITMNTVRNGSVYGIDGRETFLVHNYFRPDEEDFDAVDRDRSIRQILGVEDGFTWDMLGREDWIGRRLVADRFRDDGVFDRRVFLCGDAAHIWVPYAGYGMNAGIADAENLAWLLAAHLNGWGPVSILDAHEAERLPITEQVSRFAMSHAEKMIRARGAVPPEIDDETPEGMAARAKAARSAYDLNVQQYAAAGLNFGYYYENSPLIAADGAPPAYTMGDFTASTVPGCRTPHIWLDDGRSLYDAHGPGYTLLRGDPAIDVSALEAAMAAKGVPFDVLDLDIGPDSESAVVYDRKLILSRPDRHIAWRGDALLIDPVMLVDTVSGAGVSGKEAP